jgi:hypothetical protein
VELTPAEATDVISPVKVSNDKDFSEEKTLAKADAGNQFRPSSGSGVDSSMVEQHPFKLLVPGSNPGRPTTGAKIETGLF